MLLDILQSVFYAGVPVFVVSMFLLHWSSQLTERNKAWQLAHQKWLKFGGGFYGVMALVTYIHVEFMDLFNLFSQFSSFSELIAALGIGLIVEIIIAAVMNFVTAMLWFIYWVKHIEMQYPLLWLLVAYSAFMLALKYAPEKMKKIPDTKK